MGILATKFIEKRANLSNYILPAFGLLGTGFGAYSAVNKLVEGNRLGALGDTAFQILPSALFPVSSILRHPKFPFGTLQKLVSHELGKYLGSGAVSSAGLVTLLAAAPALNLQHQQFMEQKKTTELLNKLKEKQ